MKLNSILAITTIAVLAAPAAMAAPILIDDFSDATTQFVGDDPFMGIIAGSEVTGLPVPGGARDLYVETAPTKSLGTTLVVENGDLTFNNDSGQAGYGQVAYDGTDGAPTSRTDIDIDGLGGIDLTFGLTSASFFFEVLDADGDFTFRAIVWDMLGNTHTYAEDIFGSFSPVLSFTEFTDAGVDMTDVGALVFEVESNGTAAVDGRLGSISVIPLPASALLLLGGLGGLAGFGSSKRRRRRKA